MTEYLQAFVPSVKFLIATMLALGVGLGVYVAFRLVHRYLAPLLAGTDLFRRFGRWFPILQTIIWAGFVVFSLGYLINLSPVPGICLSLFVAIIFWQTIHNLAMGLLLRLKNDIRPGRRILVAGQRGLITDMGLLALEILNEEGQKTILSYRRISNEILTLENPFERIKTHRYIWTPPNSEFIGMAEVEQLIQQEVLRLPWAIPNRLPLVEPLDQGDGQTGFQIVMFALDEKFFPDMTRGLQHRLEELIQNGR